MVLLSPGEAILIQTRYSSHQWVGTLDDKTGLFSINDTNIYQGNINN